MNEPDVPRREAWMDAALCRGTDTGLFFPGRGENERTRDAKAVCAACPVTADCLGYALTNGEKHGVWGGCSERERRRMRRTQGLSRPVGRWANQHGNGLSEAS